MNLLSRFLPSFSLRRSCAAALALAAAFLPDAVGKTSLPRVMAAVSELEAEIHQEMCETGIPGVAVAVVYQDELIYSKGFGVLEAGQPAPVNADTVFQLASISKPVGATVLAALIGQDAGVRWDSQIKELDPDFALHDPAATDQLTIGDLYSHRSGLPEHVGDILEDIGFSQEEILRRLRFQPQAGPFRKSYAYTNFGLTEGAVAAAKKAGVPWETLSERLLYGPLGMNSTSSTLAGFLRHENRARGHQRVDGKWVHLEQRKPDAQSPAGGVSSSVTDMAKWMRMVLNNGTFEGRQIIAPEALAETLRPQMDTGSGSYGYGWNVANDSRGRLRLSHSGAFFLGAGTIVVLAPEDQLGVIVLTNAAPIGLAEALAAGFMDNALLGSRSRDWNTLFRDMFRQIHDKEWAMSRQYDVPPVNPDPPLDASAYTGTYANDFYGPAKVVERNSGLVLLLGPNEKPYPMTHWNGNTYTYVTDGELGAGRSGIFFTVEKGSSSAMRIEFFDRDRNGTLTKVHGK
jgi:CubicO group peptidase (beta-lactamase class C family)